MLNESKLEIQKGVFIKMIEEGDKSFFVLQNEAGFTTNLVSLRKDILLYSNSVYIRTYLKDRLSGIFMDLRVRQWIDVSVNDEKVKDYINDLIETVRREYKSLINQTNIKVDNMSIKFLDIISDKLNFNKDLITVNRDSSYGILNSSNDEIVFGLLNGYSIVVKLNLPLKDGDKLAVDHFKIKYKFQDEEGDENDFLLSEIHREPNGDIYLILRDIVDEELGEPSASRHTSYIRDIRSVYDKNIVIDYDIDIEDIIDMTLKVTDIVKDIFSSLQN